MAFLLYCTNKACRKEQEALYDVETDQVECCLCGATIDGITYFTKQAMKGLGQIKRTAKTQEAFAVSCHACKKTGQPVVKFGLDGKKGLACFSCHTMHAGISASYAHAIMQFIGMGKKGQE